jgi:putative ABC transport system permease protein
LALPGSLHLKLFTYPVFEGDAGNALLDKEAITISRNLAMKLFRTTDNLVGKSITRNGRILALKAVCY